jgi:hypothetical protein
MKKNKQLPDSGLEDIVRRGVFEEAWKFIKPELDKHDREAIDGKAKGSGIGSQGIFDKPLDTQL